MRTYTVVTRDGEFIAVITREQRNRLRGCTEDGRAPRYDVDGTPIYNPALIEVHRKRDAIFYALVDPAIIRAELQRELSTVVPIAEDSRTVRQMAYSNHVGSGRYFEHNLRHTSAFGVRTEFLRDEIWRDDTRVERLRVITEITARPMPVRPPLKTKRAIVIEFPKRIEAVPLPKAA